MPKILIAAALAAALLATASQAQPQSPGPTLSAVKQRDILVCGTSTGAAGFSVPDSRGEYRGLDSDLCRATAAAVLGDATKVRWVPLTSTARLPALQSGQVDVLIRTTTWTQVRDTANGLNFTASQFLRRPGLPAAQVARPGQGDRAARVPPSASPPAAPTS